MLELDIESLDLEGRGVAHHEGKVVFVEGALTGERVLARIVRSKSSYDKARCERVLVPSSQRVAPPCPHFGVCGGCAMQHLEPTAQLAVKQRALEDALQHLGNVQPGQILAPLQGPSFAYRYRARLSVRLVHKKGGVLVGFRERHSSYVADIRECLVLPPQVSALLLPLRELIGRLSHPARIPQIEVAVGDRITVLLLRHLEPLTGQDTDLLHEFAAVHGVCWWLQPKGPDTAHPLNPDDLDALAYALPQYGVRMHYRPTDFTQVNPFINRALVARALALLDVQPDDRVADLFCGLGNFSLPLATLAREVVGVEGSEALVQRARADAARQGLAERSSFACLNLFEVDEAWFKGLGAIDKILIDPPREGAMAVAQVLSSLRPAERPRRVVYVSCNPATLARDAGILCNRGGWTLRAVGAVNMFPHTAHVESIAVFEP
ncbi:MAG: 23S rRNA (uracil(1939)-C(5))-methyltransferase RlmD [Alcaligenaceae bacterium]|nr:23S rRNA (uracil(1939)-C(5))-methyltransferase RlmD [Alcaligenaceae bacterium]